MAKVCIGFLGADWWGSDARAMAAEFRRRGHLVIERHYEDYFPTRWRHPLLKAARRLLRPVMAGDYNRAVTELAGIQAISFLLVFKGMLLSPKTLSLFKSRGFPIYCYYPDVSFHDHGANIPGRLPYYQSVFSSKSFHLNDPSLMNLGPQWFHVPHGFDPEVHRRVNPEMRGMECYDCDVSFVGCWSPKKEAAITALLRGSPGVAVKIWGPAWERSAAAVRACWQGRGAYGDELAAIYTFSRINLGLLSEAGAGAISGDAVTARTWQIPGAGGFLLHEDTDEVRQSFIPDVEIAVFSGPDDLPAQVNRFLSDSGLRQRIARAGHARAHGGGYTYSRAVDTILNHHYDSAAGCGVESAASGAANSNPLVR